MNSYDESVGVFTRERMLTGALALLTLLAVYVCYKIAQPFVPALAFALALAVATQRPYNWLKRRVRSETAAAALAVVCVAVLIVGPIAFLLTYIVQSAIDSFHQLEPGSGVTGLRGTLEKLPYLGPLLKEAEARFRLEEQFGSVGKELASRASGFFTGSLSVLTQLVITLFVLFFLYRDCGQALHAVRKLLPLSSGEADRMFSRISSTIQATVNGSITVAIVQAVLAGVVYALLGVPLAVIWAAATFFAAFVPVFGTTLIWAPIAVYLLLTGAWVKAIILVGWAALAVGSIDNVLYPYLVGDKLRLHTVPTFFAVLGGVGFFGVSGLILGPLTLAVTIGLLDVWWSRTESGEAAEQAVAPHAEEKASPGEVLHDR